MLSFDIPSLLTFVLTALALILGSLFVVKKAASRYFVVDASFETGEGYESRGRMSIGGAGDGDGCAACGKRGTKLCARCKRVRYCSQTCQSKHWRADHKLKCKQTRSLDKIDVVSLGDDTSGRRGSSKFSSVSLVPARGTSKVLQEPKKILFPYDKFLKLYNWDKPGFPPCGLLNCGNSCFANVVLQCLTCTRPLTAYLLEGDHARQCIRKQEGWCFLCELQAHIRRASESQQPFSPINILSRIPSIGGNFSRGSQEDAHEFMRFAIDSMQSACLDEHGGEKALDCSTQETTLIQHIFGGYLQSQVVCMKCHMISSRYENMMDLTVEIHGVAESLEECLNQFTVSELLDGVNKYKCDGCNDYVKACKRLTVHQAPNILTITLKRYHQVIIQGGIFSKLNQRVTFPDELDLTPYMSGGGDGTDVYFLYAVVVHQDMLNASFFGHYICYTKDYHGQWYRSDDCKVVPVDAEEVHSQGAYMLLYSRRTPRKEPFVKSTEPLKKKISVSTDINLSIESSADTHSLSSNTDSQSIFSFSRDSGHERQMDTETEAMKGKDNDESEVHAEADPTVLHKDPQNIDICDSKLSSLHPKNSEEGSTSSVDISISPGTPPLSESQTMEYEESNGIHLEEGSVCTSGGVPDQSRYASENSLSGRNTVFKIIHDVADSSPDASFSSSSSMDPKAAKNSELNLDPVVVAGHHRLGSTNGVHEPAASVADKNRRPKGPVSGSVGKPKPLFSRGFLDRPTAERRTKTASMSNGHPNGHSELKNETSSVPEACKKAPFGSEVAFMNPGFLMRNGQTNINNITTNGNIHDKENVYNAYKIDSISKLDEDRKSNGEPAEFEEHNGSAFNFMEG